VSMLAMFLAGWQPAPFSERFPLLAFRRIIAVLPTNYLAVRQPLPPWLLRCRHRFILQAWMSLKRFFCYITASSCRTTPSGFVSGGGAVGRAWWPRRSSGDGARRQGLDRVCKTCFRVQSVLCKDLAVIFFYLQVLPVIYTPPTMN
jgi:hypothetical protein